MKKSLIIISIIVLSIISIFAYNFYNYKAMKNASIKNNKVYESFLNEQVLGTDVISLINKAIDSNDKNEVQKDSNGQYIDNGKNSVQIEIKFLELDKTISMEAINGQGYTQFVHNFGTYNFKCTKIEYHNSTKNVKYMYFEQI